MCKGCGAGSVHQSEALAHKVAGTPSEKSTSTGASSLSYFHCTPGVGTVA